MRNFFMVIVMTILVVQNHADYVNFNGKIAGDREISECVNGYKPTMTIDNREMYITTSQLAWENGYEAEEHVVTTDDGYILTLHRIPGKPGATPIFLQHGLACSSFDWLVLGKEKALGFKLADAGYDVWMGNTRGNTYSRCHTKYPNSGSKFWDFSWHEIGIYDLPAMITYVTNITRQQVIYIGHSMGTTAFFVMAIERPDIASRVKVMFGLSPVAYIDHTSNPLTALAPLNNVIKFLEKLSETGEVLSQSPNVKNIIKGACTQTILQREYCSRLVLSVTGFNPSRFDYTLATKVLYHYPAGTSFKSLIHYLQQFTSKKFQYYDYGMDKNLQLYKNTEPPSYNLSKIAVPIGLFWSSDDSTVSPIDVKRLYQQLPNAIFSYRVDRPNFNHNDYSFSIDAPKYVYDQLLRAIKNYR